MNIIYPFKNFESKWRERWESQQAFKAITGSPKPKYYALNMFPYPSGQGLHMGHLVSYTPTDVISRYKRALGFNVLQPMGYDAFGLPAEQYAIQTKSHPKEAVKKAIDSFRKTLKTMGYSFDWSREFSTTDPATYKGTQKIFIELFNRGLAYQKEVPVNWCPGLKTVLANDEVIDGKSERGGHPVVRKKMKQWVLKITAFADQLLEGLEEIDWPESTKASQRDWIGKSNGAVVTFTLPLPGESIKVFTTRPDTLFGATFMVLAPEHPLVEKLTHADKREKISEYITLTARKSEIDRKADTDKTGVFTGSCAKNPINGKDLPIWIADYVLPDYGSGAIMAVPGHDSRDFEFATKFSLPIERVISSPAALPFEGEGPLVNSDFLNDLNSPEAIIKMIAHLESNQLGKGKTEYKIRDWVFSRQRFWGEPFPIVHYDSGETRVVDADELPVCLPDTVNFEPSDRGEAPLAKIQEFIEYKNSKTNETGKREVDTMPGSAGSSWYFLRYTDPSNPSGLFDFEAQKYWMPVDFYLGGSEHRVGHLLYSRFWQRVLFDAGLVSHKEPFAKLVHQGTVMGQDGSRMSKSRGNVVNPHDVCEKYGVDATRVYVMFMGPYDKDRPWNLNGIEGIKRFLERLWRLCVDDTGKCIAREYSEIPEELEKSFHRCIKKVTEDLESLSLNTPISAFMIFVNDLYKHKMSPKSYLKTLCQLLMPYAPYITEELWHQLGGEGLVALAPWPTFNPDLCTEDLVTLAVQVNGKMKTTIEISKEALEEDALKLANEDKKIQSALEGKELKKVIYKAGRILSLIAK